ncbi:hypothetical protein [Nonomuraea sp. NPDC050643]
MGRAPVGERVRVEFGYDAARKVLASAQAVIVAAFGPGGVPSRLPPV